MPNIAYPRGRRQSRKNGQDIRQRVAVKRGTVRRRGIEDLPDLCRQYLDHRALMLSRHYSADADEWLRFLWREILGPDPFNLTSMQIEIWALGRISVRKSKVATVESYVFALHLFFKWAIKAGLTSVDPALDVQLPRHRRPFRKVFGSIEQVKTLINECQNQQLKFILYAGIHGGLRKAEISAARWSWFDFGRMTINVTRDEFFDTKDGEDRSIPLTVEFARFMAIYPHENDYCIYNGRRNAGRRYRYDFRKLYGNYITAKCEEHGFPRLTIHDMRRTFASLLVSNKNITVYQVGRWLGDDTRTVERHYGWLQPHRGEINGAFE